MKKKTDPHSMKSERHIKGGRLDEDQVIAPVGSAKSFHWEKERGEKESLESPRSLVKINELYVRARFETRKVLGSINGRGTFFCLQRGGYEKIKLEKL